MNKSLPPLAWFRAFECAARHLNFTHAARELNLTQSAVSQHIRALEHRLGSALFVRQHRKLFLTDSGRRLLPSVSSSIAQLREATRSFDVMPGTNTLNISVSVSIAQWYLAPRLKHFLHQHPELDIRVVSKVWSDEFSGSTADLEIRFDSPDSAEQGFELLCSDSSVVVSSPNTIGDICDQPMINVVGTNDTWARWADKTEYKGTLNIRASVESHGMAVDFARSGMGVAFTSFTIAAPSLVDGSLVLHGKELSPAHDGYYIRISESENQPIANVFADWLRNEIEMAKS